MVGGSEVRHDQQQLVDDIHSAMIQSRAKEKKKRALRSSTQKARQAHSKGSCAVFEPARSVTGLRPHSKGSCAVFEPARSVTGLIRDCDGVTTDHSDQ
jgi:hypothetical protein